MRLLTAEEDAGEGAAPVDDARGVEKKWNAGDTGRPPARSEKIDAAEEDGCERSTEAASPSMALGCRGTKKRRGDERRRRWRGEGRNPRRGGAGAGRWLKKEGEEAMCSTPRHVRASLISPRGGRRPR